ncbi:hypothetical protein BIW11_04335 [Tropilaelaps mercedesae]|uniref:Uncharacterized protein n=1 Tax=Tropilaelaps mercedesae TaxID=418985 RepID=A0A1V9X7R9_9ACAR|nr:hypothetical protein BIW11_04335 [Tropilaelaps mercedesae]
MHNYLSSGRTWPPPQRSLLSRGLSRELCQDAESVPMKEINTRETRSHNAANDYGYGAAKQFFGGTKTIDKDEWRAICYGDENDFVRGMRPLLLPGSFYRREALRWSKPQIKLRNRWRQRPNYQDKTCENFVRKRTDLATLTEEQQAPLTHPLSSTIAIAMMHTRPSRRQLDCLRRWMTALSTKQQKQQREHREGDNKEENSVRLCSRITKKVPRCANRHATVKEQLSGCSRSHTRAMREAKKAEQPLQWANVGQQVDGRLCIAEAANVETHRVEICNECAGQSCDNVTELSNAYDDLES